MNILQLLCLLVRALHSSILEEYPFLFPRFLFCHRYLLIFVSFLVAESLPYFTSIDSVMDFLQQRLHNCVRSACERMILTCLRHHYRLLTVGLIELIQREQCWIEELIKLLY